MEPDWSNLPKDILETVSKKIASVSDYLRCRAVCIPWRSALSPSPRHLPIQPPWLLLPYNPNVKQGNDDDSNRFFYDFSTSRIRRINLPETCGKQFCGSSQGWLALESGPQISLLNPITRVEMQLPSLEMPPVIWGVSGVESEERMSSLQSQLDIWSSRLHRGLTDPIIQRFILTSKPTDPDCVVMALFKTNWGLAFCRIGDESWTVFEAPARDGIGNGLIDATYHNGLFYCFSFDEVKVYNLNNNTREVMKIIIPLEQAGYHLIEGEVEELLLVAQHWAPHGLSKRDQFSIYKLVIGDDGPDWIETSGIGKRMCFICEGIEQCFTFPIDNFQMQVLGGNLLCYASPLIVEKNREDYWGWHPEDNFGYDIKMVKFPTVEVPYFSNYWRDHVIELVKNLGSYPTAYSRGLWITPSFH
ncbi:F-box protein skip23 [Rhynchospora pubera]|uniref:F-box protein skip23 n=1 Tax=Rhynchospora pubera TaxID=906938 RepID=A0AAV8BYV2_9POAL|nr:F-box protein skip23 [Rhynchospora pubera]